MATEELLSDQAFQLHLLGSASPVSKVLLVPSVTAAMGTTIWARQKMPLAVGWPPARSP